MKAIVKDKTFAKLVDVEIPVIDNLNNVLVKVELAAICRTDIYVANGIIPTKENLILGHEFYGEVVEILDNVQNIKVGDKVTINPTIFGKNKDKMCGIDVNGAFCEYIKVPEHSIYKLPNHVKPKYAAFCEPIAASLAVLNVNFDIKSKICIYGKNRISELTYKILKLHNYENVTIIDSNNEIENETYDIVIETVVSTTDFNKIVKAVKKNGIFILKSRQYKPVEICINDLVKKEIKIFAVNYGNFQKAVELLLSEKFNIDSLFGKTYQLSDFKEAFDAANSTEAKKIFLEI